MNAKQIAKNQEGQMNESDRHAHEDEEYPTEVYEGMNRCGVVVVFKCGREGCDWVEWEYFEGI